MTGTTGREGAKAARWRRRLGPTEQRKGGVAGVAKAADNFGMEKPKTRALSGKKKKG